MSDSYYINRNEERDGEVVLFNRANAKKPIWHMRLYVKGMKNADGSKQQYLQKSTGTTNYAEAVRIALDEHDRLKYKVRHNKPVTDVTFASMYEIWFSTKKSVELAKRYANKGREGRNPRIIWYEKHAQRYWIPFFGDTLVNDINNTQAERYWRWRQDYWKNASQKERKAHPNHALEPSKKSLAMEQSALREVFGWGHSEGLVENIPAIVSPYTRDGSGEKRRASFDKDEWERIDRYMRDKWVKGKGNNDRRDYKVNRNVLWTREMVRRYIQFIQSTGMRPGECLQLKHRDIEIIKTKKGSEVLRIHIPRNTKTGERIVHSMKSTVRYYKAIRSHTKHTKKDDWVFCDEQGAKSKGYIHQIKSMLKDLNLYKDKNGENRTAYSFRHYYAEQRLDEIGTHPQAMDYIATNMGTSWLMLQNFYIRKGRNIDIDTLTSYNEVFDI